MENRRIQQLVVLGVFSIVVTLGLQAYWTIHNWQLNASALDRQITLALQRVSRDLAVFNGSQWSPSGMVLRKSKDYYVVNTREVIEPATLEFFLRREMDSVALKLDYQYAIYDCDSNRMAYTRYVRFDRLEPVPARESLPRESGLTYYFGIRFPTLGSHLINRMRFSLGLTAVSLVSLLIFAFSLYLLLRQKRLSDLQKDFINNMTHEFKTPISTIRIAADVLARSPKLREDGRLAKYASIVQEQNQRLNRQVGKVLQVAQMERKSFSLELERVDLAAIVEEVVDSARLLAAEKKGELHFDMPPEALWVSADPFHTANLVHNLIDNALKYAQPDPRVSVRLVREQRGLCLRVRDNGPGIPSEYRRRVVEKFFRVPSGNVHNVKGFGLGLFYVRRVCEKHGWSFHLDCPAEGGTLATILIENDQ